MCNKLTYACRGLAQVRRRDIAFENGTVVLEQSVKSEPSPPSAFLRTLAPAMEIARLQRLVLGVLEYPRQPQCFLLRSENDRLIHENEQIPVLQGALAELEQQRQGANGRCCMFLRN